MKLPSSFPYLNYPHNSSSLDSPLSDGSFANLKTTNSKSNDVLKTPNNPRKSDNYKKRNTPPMQTNTDMRT